MLRARSPGFHPYGNSLLFKRMGGTCFNNRIFQLLTLFHILYKKCKSKDCIGQVFLRSFFLFCCEQKRKKRNQKRENTLINTDSKHLSSKFSSRKLHENFVRKCKESVTEVTTGGHPLLPPFDLRFIPSPAGKKE